MISPFFLKFNYIWLRDTGTKSPLKAYYNCYVLFFNTFPMTIYFQFQTTQGSIHFPIYELCLRFINCCVRLNVGFIVDSASIVYLVLPVRSRQRCNGSIIHSVTTLHSLNIFQWSQTPLRSLGDQFRPEPLNLAYYSNNYTVKFQIYEFSDK